VALHYKGEAGAPKKRPRKRDMTWRLLQLGLISLLATLAQPAQAGAAAGPGSGSPRCLLARSANDSAPSEAPVRQGLERPAEPPVACLLPQGRTPTLRANLRQPALKGRLVPAGGTPDPPPAWRPCPALPCPGLPGPRLHVLLCTWLT
jgi:hypothetical protein